jgi:hypothetical protein
MAENRSLKFTGQLAGGPYDATISVEGGVTGMKFGTLMLTRDDLYELNRITDGLLCELDADPEAF